MEGFSIFHWIIVLGVVALYGYPAWLILRRTGFSGWWIVLWFIPLANLVGLWLFATARWPNQNAGSQVGM